ncbi:hypothetical protein E2C01_078272 [Portunus trituberculatus]|uniref:Uncharacterized protein n=1 Tax=Portunus trituberculatus TaxID=210409 RepID=A0A5B7IGK0_PORTR|nr:hypothetical protein [Portunus trituberculatus]
MQCSRYLGSPPAYHFSHTSYTSQSYYFIKSTRVSGCSVLGAKC